MTHAVYVSQALLLISESQEKKDFYGGDRRHIICSQSYLYFPVIDFIIFVIYNFEIILLLIIFLLNFNLHKGKEVCLPHSML